MEALGLIETRGLVGAVEASDAAVKSAEAVVAQLEITDAAMVTVKLRGGVADVQAAVEAGAAAARRVGEVVAAHVIPRPHDELDVLIEHKPQMTTAGWDAMPAPNAKESSGGKESKGRKK